MRDDLIQSAYMLLVNIIPTDYDDDDLAEPLVNIRNMFNSYFDEWITSKEAYEVYKKIKDYNDEFNKLSYEQKAELRGEY